MRFLVRIRQSVTFVSAITLFIALRFAVAIPEVSISNKNAVHDYDFDPNVNIIELISTLSKGMGVGQVSPTENIELQLPIIYISGANRYFSTLDGGLNRLFPRKRPVAVIARYILVRNLRI